MPILLSKPINSFSSYAIWKISETEAQLLEKIDETPPVAQPNKRSEWIVTRILIKHLCKIYGIEYQGIDRLDSGKPILVGSDAEISITHSFPLAAALINLRNPCGIDLEWPRQKLALVARKFLNKQEEKYTKDLEALCKVWVAKEVLFKIYGNKYLSLKNELSVEFQDDWSIKGKINKNGSSGNYDIAIEPINNYLLAYNI